MHHTKTATWIAAAAGLAGVAAYMYTNRMRVGMHMSPGHQLVFEETSELARVDLEKAAVGAAVVGLGGWLLTSFIRRRQEPVYAPSGHAAMSSVDETIDVEVPVSTAYNQWTQFEEFPRFMSTVEEVTQLDDQRLHWRALVAGKPVEWDAEITRQIPDQLIEWRSTSGPRNRGLVTFNKIGENRARVKLEMFYEPEGARQKVGSALGAVKLTTKANLQKFKQLVEAHGVETGAWRESIPRH